MKKIKNGAIAFFLKADLVLLLLCVAATLFGVLMISSASRHTGSNNYVIIQLSALAIGVVLYVFLSFVKIDYVVEKWELLFIFNVLFILSLVFFGESGGTGNKSWIRFSFLPIGIQPAEICKITFILILAKQMSLKRDKLSSPLSVFQYLAHTFFMVALISFVSHDDGMALVYLVIFIFMAIAAGIKPLWFAVGAVVSGAALPLVWKYVLGDFQRNRILVILDPSVDSAAQAARWQSQLSKSLIGAGQLFGQGLNQGSQTQTGQLTAQHTDFIFAVIGEELGFVGCAATIILLGLIILRCLYIGVKSNNYMNRLICSGIASMLIFQIIVNIGMCIGLVPVIGLTLPFLSYGGSSIVTMFAAMGLISGIKMRPSTDRPIKYIHPGQYY